MTIHDNSIIPVVLSMLSRNVEGGDLDIRLYADRNDTGWQLWASGLKGTWYLHVVKGAQNWTTDTLVAELRIDGKPRNHLHWPVHDWPNSSPNAIVKEMTTYFVSAARALAEQS